LYTYEFRNSSVAQSFIAGFVKICGFRLQNLYEHFLEPIALVSDLGNLYVCQGKLGEAEEIFQRVLNGYEKALGPDHTLTLALINNLGILYAHQGKLGEAEEMYQCALKGLEKALGSDHILTLKPVNDLGLLYWNQDRLKEAEEMYLRTENAVKSHENTGYFAPRATCSVTSHWSIRDIDQSDYFACPHWSIPRYWSNSTILINITKTNAWFSQLDLVIDSLLK
jgi:tetratricopeptide (TPR) repeat protein